MIDIKCINKFKDAQGRIIGYRIQDTNGTIRDVRPQELKNAIINKQVNVINLTLTSNNRIIDKTTSKAKMQTQSSRREVTAEQFIDALRQAEKDFTNKFGGIWGECKACGTSDGFEYTDTILEVFKYYNKEEDEEQIYNVEVTVAFNGETGWMGLKFTEDNTGDIGINVTRTLKAPLCSIDNIVLVKRAFEEFAGYMKKWLSGELTK